jgi:hypothetical protein
VGTIAIKLDPARLNNPDLDIRYNLSDLIEAATMGQISADGYDYVEEDNNPIVVFLKSAQPLEDVKVVLDVLRQNTVCGNDLLPVVVVAVSDETGRYVVVHPPGAAPDFKIDP